LSLPSGVAFASNNFGGGFSSGPSFFDRLFGPPTPPAPIGRRVRTR
jgi:L,D-transpeptidase YcbB